MAKTTESAAATATSDKPAAPKPAPKPPPNKYRLSVRARGRSHDVGDFPDRDAAMGHASSAIKAGSVQFEQGTSVVIMPITSVDSFAVSKI